MKDELDSICPIFIRYSNGMTEQVGSGVLFKSEDDLYLLTAAHVIDWSTRGTLCIPCNDGINPIVGYVSSIYAPLSIDRSKDKLDFGYYKINEIISKKLYENFKPIAREECWLSDNIVEDDIYSFSGFPLNKSKQKGGIISSEFFSYSGTAVNSNAYTSLNYNQETNIIVNFRMKKATNTQGQRISPPHPKGISGGGIFRWPKILNKNFKRSLVGIGHTYLSHQNLLIGTKLNVLLSFIARRNPSVYAEPNINLANKNSIPFFIGLAYYKKEEWPLLLSQFEDSNKMHKSHAEWREAAENGIEYMHQKGNLMVPIELSAEEISVFCRMNNLPNISKTRNLLVSKKLNELIRDSEYINY